MDNLEERELLALYSQNCLKCSHLVDVGTRAFNRCHYTQGNKECPAKEVALVVVGKARQYAQRVLKARTERNLPAEANLLGLVAKESEAFQEKFRLSLDELGTT